MSCYRCPHYVRHGQPSKDRKSITFRNLCGLKIKRQLDSEPVPKKPRAKKPETTKHIDLLDSQGTDCINFPFASAFDYFQCLVYQKTFESSGLKNGVVPTKDFQFSEKLRGTSVTDMELL